jgi:hypothetical protein
MNTTSTNFIAFSLFFALSLLKYQTTTAFLYTKLSFSNRVTQNTFQMTRAQLRLAGFQDAFASPDPLDDYVAEKNRQQKALKRCAQTRNQSASDLIVQKREFESLLLKRNRLFYMFQFIKRHAKKLIIAFKTFMEPSCDMIQPVYLHSISNE